MFFHTDVGANISVANCISQFYKFVPTKDAVKLANGQTGNAEEVGIFLCRFPNCSIIYPVIPVYYCLGHPYRTISLGALKCYVDFQKCISETLEHCDIVDTEVSS